MDTPVFEFEVSKTRRGIMRRVACFAELRVHVPYVVEAISHPIIDTEFLIKVGRAKQCDGSCVNRLGKMADYSMARNRAAHAVDAIVKKASSFFEKTCKQ